MRKLSENFMATAQVTSKIPASASMIHFIWISSVRQILSYDCLDNSIKKTRLLYLQRPDDKEIAFFPATRRQQAQTLCNCSRERGYPTPGWGLLSSGRDGPPGKSRKAVGAVHSGLSSSRRRRMTLPTPPSLFAAVISSATAFTAGSALAMATPRAAICSISRSLVPSPKATVPS